MCEVGAQTLILFRFCSCIWKSKLSCGDSMELGWKNVTKIIDSMHTHTRKQDAKCYFVHVASSMHVTYTNVNVKA